MVNGHLVTLCLKDDIFADFFFFFLQNTEFYRIQNTKYCYCSYLQALAIAVTSEFIPRLVYRQKHRLPLTLPVQLVSLLYLSDLFACLSSACLACLSRYIGLFSLYVV